MSRRSQPREPSLWTGPLLALVALAAGASLLLARLTQGAEITDDAPHLLQLVRSPLTLFGAPESQDLPATWRSYPPLLPPLFGLAVRPWLVFASDFAAIRLGALCWTALALAATGWLATHHEKLAPAALRRALWTYALLPSVWIAVALVPQEESYVSLFVVALYATHLAGRSLAQAALFALAALAGKVFLLALIVPLALAGPRPLRDLLAGAVAAGTGLAAYLAYHALRFGEIPLLGYQLDAATSISAWSLLLNLGLPLPAAAVQLGSALATVLAVTGFALAARRRGLAPLHSVAASLWIMLLSVSIAMPPYVLWNLPLTAIALARLPQRALRRASLLLLAGWGLLAYLAKLLRGVQLALEVDRGAGKSAVAAPVVELLGTGFPYHGARTAVVGLLLLGSLAMVALLWRTAPVVTGRQRPA